MAGAGGKRITGAFKIRRNGTAGFSIGILAHIGDALFDHNIYFVAQFVDEGILLKPLAVIDAVLPLPEWAKAHTEA